MIYRVCLSYAKNKTEAEDCVSETFVKLMRSCPPFNDEEHEKAWLIRTASNICKNRLKHWSKKNLNIDDFADSVPVYDSTYKDSEHDKVLDAVQNLPEKFRTPVYLYYYEGYSTAEIAEILGKPDSTIRGCLSRARGLLKAELSAYGYSDNSKSRATSLNAPYE